eukprot:CAMPEP_0198539976 /NCGR_PEP_ID=MMETSP1462-20131121/51156_1 /TAXON_ID=1333877 /ORGANISM="Brandtodinium nutriculum, Strain RCC3387" /LENGTH=210 /DNA_ID=CAMNT_0044270061 /DNA_START=8 /DNA_END=640 /DNA_ORIENTATION=+
MADVEEETKAGEAAWPASIPRVSTGIVKWEHQEGHRAFNTYKLPKWVKHPDSQKTCMYLQPEDYMGSKRRHNPHGWNIAHVGAQCSMFEGQGFKMLQKATVDELNAHDNMGGFTPLHWAVLADNPKAVIWLLKHGADRDIVDLRGRKAEDLVDDHWGEFYQRYWEHGPTQDGQLQPDKVFPKRVKQMKDAFQLKFAENEYDIEGYKAIIV